MSRHSTRKTRLDDGKRAVARTLSYHGMPSGKRETSPATGSEKKNHFYIFNFCYVKTETLQDPDPDSGSAKGGDFQNILVFHEVFMKRKWDWGISSEKIHLKTPLSRGQLYNHALFLSIEIKFELVFQQVFSS